MSDNIGVAINYQHRTDKRVDAANELLAWIMMTMTSEERMSYPLQN